MGGIGSGGWNRTDRATTDETLRLDVTVARRHGALAPGWRGEWSWTRHGGDRSQIGMEAEEGRVTLRFSVRIDGRDPQSVAQVVSVSWEPCRFGGERPYWLCPGCGRRVAILHGVRRFLCRSCNRLTYASQREREHDRVQRRANKIRQRLGGEPGLGQIPPKPPRMHRRTYERLIEEIFEADMVTEDYAAALLVRLERPAGERRSRGGFWT